MVRLGGQLPFARAAELLAFFWEVWVSEDTVRRATEGAGAALVAVEAQALEHLEQTFPPAPVGPALLQWSLDGAFVPLQHGEWAEVKTAAIGVVEPATGTREAHTSDLSYWSRLADAPTFERQVHLEVQRRGLQTAGAVVAVSDGAPWIQGIVDTYRRDAVRILDFPHAVSHLASAAQATFGADATQQHAWLTAQAHRLKHHGPAPILAALHALPVDSAPDPPAAQQARDATLGYLSARLAMLRSPQFRAQGFPIGSGAIESACKLVVEARLKGSGMHWQRANVSPLLALRASWCSGHWAQDWPSMLREMRRAATERRHRRRRDHPPPPAPPTPPAATPPPVHLSAALRRLRRQQAPTIVDGKPTHDHPWRRYPHQRAA